LRIRSTLLLSLVALAAVASGCPESTVEPDATTDTSADTGSSTGSLVVNEIVCSRADGGPDWIEVYANGTEPVDLGRYAVRDDDATRAPVTLPAKTLQPGEFLVIIADTDDPGGGEDWVDFRLGGGDAVVLSLDGTDVQVLDWEEGEAPESTAYGLLIDGDTAQTGTLKPTPGAPNEAWDGPLPSELDLFVGDTVYAMELELTPEDWADMQAQPLLEKWYRGTLKMGGHVITDIGIRTKSTTDLRVVHGTESRRFSLRVDANRYVPGQRIDGRRGFVLNNNYMDPSYMRESLGYYAYREAGLKAPKTQFVDVTLAGEHVGLYTLVELVDKEFLQDYFPDADDGDLYEPEQPAGTLQYAGSTPSAYPKMGLETNEETSDGSTFVSLVSALNDGSPETRLNVGNALAYLAMTAALGNLDSYLGPGTNYYLYDEVGRFSLIPWDLDQAFGTFDCGCGDAVLTLPIETPTCGPRANRPLVDVLLGDASTLADYRVALTELVAAGGAFTSDVLNGRIAVLQSVIQPYVEADPTKLFTTQEFLDSLDATITKPVALSGGADRVIPGLRPFIASRVASIQAQLAGQEAATGPGDSVCGP